MLGMPTLQVSYPMQFFVLVESNDLSFHFWFHFKAYQLSLEFDDHLSIILGTNDREITCVEQVFSLYEPSRRSLKLIPILQPWEDP